MTRALLILLLVLAGCGPRPNARAELQTAVPTAPPTVTVLGDGTRGGLLIVTFRAPFGAPLSDSAPARVRLGDQTLEAPLDAGPATRTEGRDVIVTQATYRLDGAGRATLAKAGASARLIVTLNGASTEFPFVRGDVIE